ncbi:hypothetical protein [Herbiconiux sp. A18JL235]|uniref:DUF6966 domain-containing protein n=1 Tax=Herbiconiux sp. A18JL235 TaxID=3152363 RepID=A0AB39BGV2_9MICO
MERDRELQESLRDLSVLLRAVGETPWADRCAQAAERVAAGGDPAEVRRLFGGMGSLNDLVIHPVNGHAVADGQVDRINRALAGLRERIYSASHVTCGE